jgi:ketosteroid isomerase-like protein
VSQENVDIVRNLMDAYLRGDFGTVFTIFHPDVEFRPPPEFPDFEVCHGVDEMNRSFRMWTGSWETLRFGATDYVDAGEKVLVVHHQWGKVKGTGVEVETDVFNLFTLRAGRVVRFDMFFKRDPALEAAGLAEDARTSSK